MVKGKEKKIKKSEIVQQQTLVIDKYTRIIQIIALISVIIIALIDQLGLSQKNLPMWLPMSLMGLAVGLSPEQFIEIIKTIVRKGRK